MKGRFLMNSSGSQVDKNIYADKSSLVLDWLLRVGINRETFSIREVVKEVGVSIGLVQGVFKSLIFQGLLQVQGVRTAKTFSFKKANLLLKSWRDHYSIVKKCKMRTYHSPFQGKTELLEVLKSSNVSHKVALALHSAAEAHGCKNTNLNTLELYVLDPTVRLRLEKILQLEPQERGYEVLLIEPYYKSLLNLSSGKNVKICPLLLTFLDLYHFPLRGHEQAEFMAQRISELKRIYKS